MNIREQILAELERRIDYYDIEDNELEDAARYALSDMYRWISNTTDDDASEL